MTGASISRWTMSYFAAALFFLLGGEALFAAGFGFPVLPIEAPETLVVVHIFAIGWLGLLFCGALLQFVPVLVSKPLHAPDLALHALLLLIAGLLCLVCGFVHLAGYFDGGLVLLPVGGMFLAAGFGFVVYMVGGTLLSARPIGLPARFVATGLVALTATAILGVSFALDLSGVIEASFLDQLLVNGLSLHAFLGLIGWMSVSAFGVSYRMLAMFLLAPEIDRRTTSAAWLFLTVAVLAVIVAIPVAAYGLDATAGVHAAIAIAIIAACLFAYDVVNIYRQRKRRSLELNTQMSAVAVGALMLAIGLFLFLSLSGTLASQIGALVYLIAFGWLTVLGLGQLYKIVAFITWLEYYGPVLGRKPVPRIQDLINERRASSWFYLYAGCVAASVLALLLEMPLLFRLAALIQLIAVAALVIELARTRKLSYVAIAPAADGENLQHPPLFLPTPIKRK
ncbi:hypothetical protein LH464_13430 [Neorhizobium sp. T786]|uniref:hypothetical protein n=1 Tax=Pseudorhizobium xiangyangii TaxID=2883104 RepID=UPI001CFF9355|nr:hypothetical protein [Neorhizobium xiangyangii]MCB5203477.1 hypothetical protein [Neorhizobium xiangyangii]